MKKILIIMLCLILPFCFISCTKSTDITNSAGEDLYSQESNIQEENMTDKSDNHTVQDSKNITKLYVFCNGIKIDITSDKDKINEIIEAEKNADVPKTKLVTKFADVFAVYDDNSENIYGKIYIGEDDYYYLKFENSEKEGAAFKLPDNSSLNDLV